MTGLLHRLAARAAGTARRARSEATLPFRGGSLGAGAWTADDPVPLLRDMDGEGAALRTASAPAVADVPAASPGLDPLRPAIGPAARRTAAAEDIAGPIPHRPAFPLSRDAIGGAPAAVARGRPPHAPAPPSADPGSAGITHPSRPGPRSAQAAVEIGPDRTATTPSPEHAKTAQHPAASPPVEESHLHHGRPADPPPLLPPSAAPDRAASPRDPRLPGLPAERPVPPAVPPEVHVHIGRIEVTAIREAPAPRRERAGRPAPRSLEAYLSARDRP